MPVTLLQTQLSDALRLTDSAEEIAEATRLLSHATAAVARHLGDAYEAAPEAVVNEAAIRLAGYLFDQPNAGRGMMYADALRSSGAAMILLPFRVIRAGSTGDAVAAASPVEPAGGASNAVVAIDWVPQGLQITFADGTVVVRDGGVLRWGA